MGNSLNTSGVPRRSFVVGAAGLAALGMAEFGAKPASAATYVFPVASHTVSDNFEAHKSRDSVNPGTDYVTPTGSAVWAVASGTVVLADDSMSGSGGRMVFIDHDDGSKTDYLHLKRIDVVAGQRVAQGQQVALSGGSGYNSETYYGAHLHISLHIGPSAQHGTRGGSVDFENYVGTGPSPVQGEDEDMGRLVKHPNGSVAFAATDGTFTVLTSMDEVEALKATGAVTGDIIALSDPFIWNLRLQVAQKRKTQNEI